MQMSTAEKKGFGAFTFVVLAYVILAGFGGAASVKNHLIGMSGWVAPLYAAVGGIFIVVSIVIFMQLAAVFENK